MSLIEKDAHEGQVRPRSGSAPHDPGPRRLASACSTQLVGSSLRGVTPVPIEHDQNLSPIIRRHKNTAPLLLSGPARRAAAMTDVRGHALACGHFLPEEAPDETLAELTGFFLGA